MLIAAAMVAALLTASKVPAQNSSRATLLQSSKNMVVSNADGQRQFYLVNGQQTYTVHRHEGALSIGSDTFRTADIATIRFQTMERFAVDEESSELGLDSNVEAGLLAFRRSMNVGRWNTIVLPFSLSAEQVRDAFGDDVLVAQAVSVSEGDAATVEYAVVSADHDRDIVIEQGKPYLIRPTREPDIAEGSKTSVNYGNSRILGPVYLIDRVSVSKDDPKAVATTIIRSDSKNTNVRFYGTFTATSVTPDRRPIYMLNDEGRFGLTEEETPVNGFRTWVEVSKNNGELPLRFYINGIEEDLTLPTAIDATFMYSEQRRMNNGVFDLQGRRVAIGQQPTAKGVYIINGKKTIIR